MEKLVDGHWVRRKSSQFAEWILFDLVRGKIEDLVMQKPEPLQA